MFTPKVKKEISDFIQDLLQEIDDSELPKGEISFLLHVDGETGESWANIRNESEKNDPVPIPFLLNRNTQFY